MSGLVFSSLLAACAVRVRERTHQVLLNRPGLSLRLGLGLMLGLFAACPHTWAATDTVTSAADDGGVGTLRAVLESASSGDTIVFASAITKITLTKGQILIGKPLTINGNGVVIDGGHTVSVTGSRIFEIDNVYNNAAKGVVALTSLTIQNGNSGFQNGNSGFGGGGVLVDSNASVSLTGCTLSGNSAASGGGLYNSGTTILTGCTLSGNSGGLFNQGTATLTGCTISGNSGESTGGLDNRGGTVTLTGCTQSGNSAGEDGGGLYNYGGTVTLTGCTISRNSAGDGDGGGLDNYSGTVMLTGCAISGNSALAPDNEFGGGGGGFSNSGTATLTDCIVSGNSADAGSGLSNSGTAILIGCTISGNSTQEGGGLYNINGTATLTDDILSGDKATSVGLENGVHQGNEVYVGNGSVSTSHCDIYSTSSGAIHGTVTDGGGNISADPLFVRNPNTSALPADYGDLHLQSTSPCIGKGATQAQTPTGVTLPATDLDGVTRLNPPSIGAYEAAGAATTPTRSWTATSLSVGADGYSRLLWDNVNGTAAFWLLDPAEHYVSQTQYGPFAGWTAQAVTTGRDLKTRVLWTTGSTAAFWRLDANNNYLDQQGYTLPSGWSAVSLSTGPDGYTRVLWDNVNGTAAFWLLDPSNRFVSQTQYGPFGGWSAQALVGGAPDASSRALWANVSGQIALWGVDPNNHYLGQQQYGPF